MQPTTLPAYSLTYGGAQALIVIRPRWWYPWLRVLREVNNERIIRDRKKSEKSKKKRKRDKNKKERNETKKQGNKK